MNSPDPDERIRRLQIALNRAHIAYFERGGTQKQWAYVTANLHPDDLTPPTP